MSLLLGKKASVPPKRAALKGRAQRWPVIWLTVCLVACALPVTLAALEHTSGDNAALGVLALVALGLLPMAVVSWRPTGTFGRFLKFFTVLALVASALWTGFCSVGVMSNERGGEFASGARSEGKKFLQGLTHFYPKPARPAEPRWINPGSQPLDIPLDALREQLRRDGMLNE